MASTILDTLALTHENLEFLRKKLTSGQYATEADLLNATLDNAREEEARLEHWIRTVCVPIAERMEADPSLGIPAEEVERRFRLRFEALEQAGELLYRHL